MINGPPRSRPPQLAQIFTYVLMKYRGYKSLTQVVPSAPGVQLQRLTQFSNPYTMRIKVVASKTTSEVGFDLQC